MNSLVDILKGCLFSNSIQQAQSMLKQYSQKPTFLQELLVLIPNQQHQILMMILTTLKNYMLARWNPPPQNNTTMIQQDQKQLLKDNLFNLYYQICSNQQAVNLYKQILHMIALVQYPWPGLQQTLQADLNSSIFASAHFFRQLAKAYEYSTLQNQRQKAEYFATNYFPKLENLVQQSLTNFNDQTSKLLTIILKTFYSSFHIQLPDYLKNQDNFVKWFVYIKTILNAQLENNVNNQKIAAKILSRMASQYLNQQLDGKNLQGWSENLRARIGQDITNTIFNCLANPNGDQQTASYILDGIIAFSKNDKLRSFFNQQNVSYIIYDRLLPNMQSNQSDLNLFEKDPYQYIRKDEDLNASMFKRNAADAIQYLLNYCNFGQKSQLMKFIQYSAETLQSNNASIRHKQVLVRQLTKMSTILKKNKFIKQQFQALTTTYFIPLLKINAPLLNSQICRLFGAYLDKMTLSPNTVTQLMGLIYQKMIGKSVVLKYNAILAFTSLLSQNQALNSAKSHFQNILQIYVKILDQFDHQNLLKCLESIVSSFSNQIVNYAGNLISHLMSKFYESYNNQQNEDGDEDGNKQAVAALSTIQQILQCPLSDENYYNASEQIIPMIKQIFDELQEYFSDVISLVNVLVYKSKTIVDAETVYVLCRKLLEGKNCKINMNGLNYDVTGLLSKVTEDSDTQYEANLISILKNLIQKLPDNILHKYPYPVHSELILALIQNKRLTQQQILNLDTNLVDIIWAQYLESYKFTVYGTGSVTNPQGLKAITGVSLYPWIVNFFDVNIVKIVLSQIQEQQQQDADDYYQQNTMQMLQKYANQQQDDSQECDQYYGSQGINYAFYYDSPFDSSKDRQMFVQKLKSLSNDDANTLMAMLNNKDKKRLQNLFA